MKYSAIQYVTNSGTDGLGREITEMVRQGWELIGPVVVDTNDDGTQYIQTMGKPIE